MLLWAIGAIMYVSSGVGVFGLWEMDLDGEVPLEDLTCISIYIGSEANKLVDALPKFYHNL